MLAFSMSFMQMGLTMVFVSKNASAENTGKDPSFCFLNHLSKDYNIQIWLHSEVLWTEV